MRLIANEDFMTLVCQQVFLLLNICFKLIRFYISEPNKVSFAALLWKERSMGERGPVLAL